MSLAIQELQTEKDIIIIASAVMVSYIRTPVHGRESVRGEISGRAHGEGMRKTEERRHAEGFCQVCPETCEHEVGQQDILLHFPRDIIHSPWVGQTESLPSLRERSVYIFDHRSDGIVRQERESGRRFGHCDGLKRWYVWIQIGGSRRNRGFVTKRRFSVKSFRRPVLPQPGVKLKKQKRGNARRQLPKETRLCLACSKKGRS